MGVIVQFGFNWIGFTAHAFTMNFEIPVEASSQPLSALWLSVAVVFSGRDVKIFETFIHFTVTFVNGIWCEHQLGLSTWIEGNS